MKHRWIPIVLALVLALSVWGALPAKRAYASSTTVKTRVTGAANWNAATTWERLLTGTVTTSSTSLSVTGVGTLFNSEVGVNDILVFDSTAAVVGTVASITDDTHLTLRANASSSRTGTAYGKQTTPIAGDNVTIGNAALTGAAVVVTLNQASATVNSLTFRANSRADQLLLGANAFTVTNNLTMNGPTSGVTKLLNVNGGSLTVGGNLALSLGQTSTNSSRVCKITITTGTVTVGGNLTFNAPSGGSSLQNQIVFSGAGVVNLAGRFDINNNLGVLTPSTSTFNFNGSAGGQTIPINASSVNYYNLVVNNTNASGATLNAATTATKVAGSITVQSGTFNNGGFNMALASGKNVTVNSGATFNMTGSATLTGTGAFTLNSGGTLGISSADGIASSGGTGNIQTSTRSFSTGANYVYNGTVAQVTGSGLPTTVNNLTMNNSHGVTLTAADTVAKTLSLGSTGKLKISTPSVNSTAYALTIGGEYQVSGTWGSSASSATNKNDTVFDSTGIGIITVSHGPAFRIGADTTTPVAGANDQLTITLVDPYGATVTSYGGDKTLTFSGLSNAPSGAAPTVTDKSGSAVNQGTGTTITFSSGVGSAGGSLVAKKAEGPVTLNVTDGTYASTASPGAGVSLTVSPDSVDHFALTTSATSFAAGTAFTVNMTAQDQYNNTTTAYVGAVGYSGTAGVTGNSANFSAGLLSAGVTPTQSGDAGLTVIATNSAGKTGTLTLSAAVSPGPLDHYLVTLPTQGIYAGEDFAVEATAHDSYHNNLTGETSQVQFTTTAADVAWTPSDGKATPSSGVASITARVGTSQTSKTIKVEKVGDASKYGTSEPFDIDTKTGAYRSKVLGTPGTWGDAGTWETYSESAWVGAGAAPSSTNGAISIIAGSTVVVAADVTVDQVHIEPGANVTVNAGKTLTVANGDGQDMVVDGTLTNNGTVTVSSSAAVIVYGRSLTIPGVLDNAGTVGFSGTPNGTLTFSGGIYKHSWTTAKGTIPTATWESGSVTAAKSEVQVIGYTSNTTTPDGLNQSFQNFTWNCTGQTGNIDLGTGFTTVTGNFAVVSSGSTGSVTLGADLTVTGAATVYDNAVLYTANKVISGGSFTLDVDGTLGIGSTGGIAASGATGNIQTITRRFVSGARYIYNGGAAQVTGDGLPGSVSYLTINNTYGVALSASQSVARGLSLATDSPLTIGASQTLKILGSLDGSGTLTGGSSSSLEVNDYGEQASITLPSISGGVHNLTLNRAAGTTLGGGVTVAGTLYLTAGAMAGGTNLTLGNDATVSRAAGSLAAAPTFTNNVNVTYTGSTGVATSYEVPSTSSVLQALTVINSGGVTLGSDATVNGALTLTSGALSIGAHTLTLDGAVSTSGGSLTGGASSNIAVGGSGASTTLPAVAAVLNNLTLNRGNGLTLGGAVTVNGTLYLTAGALTIGANLTLADGATISRAAGSLGAAPTFGSTVNLAYTGSTAVTTGHELPTDASVLYYLTVNNTAATGVSLGADATVNYVFTIGSGATLTADGHNLTANHDWTNSGTFTDGSSTVTFGGTTLIEGDGTNSFYNVIISADCGVAVDSDDSMTVAGNWTNNGIVDQSGTVIFDGTTAISGSGTNNLTNVTINSGKSVSAGSATLYVAGAWNNQGAFDAGTSTVSFGGTAPSASGLGTLIFNNLTAASSTTTFNNDATVGGALFIDYDATLDTDTHRLTYTTSTIYGWLNHNETQAVGTSEVSFVDASGATTAKLAQASGSISFTVTTQLGLYSPEGNFGGTCPAVTNAVQRFYDITPTGSPAATSVRLYYLDAELNGNTEESLYIWHCTGGSWVKLTAGREQNSSQNWVLATGVSSFSEFILSENAPTTVLVSAFEATVQDGSVVMSWETAREVGTAGFYLLRWDAAAGDWVTVNQGLVPAFLGTAPGGTYRLSDPGAQPGGAYSYVLQEIAAGGASNRYGPYEVTADGTTPAGSALTAQAAAASYERIPAPPDLDRQPAQPEPNTGADVPVELPDAAPVRAWLPAVPGAGAQGAVAAAAAAAAIEPLAATPGQAKLTVRTSGLYYVAAADIASALGLNPSQVSSLIRHVSLRLTNQGRKVDYLPASGSAGIYFYGEALQSLYTWDNVYWLAQGAGVRMGQTGGKAPDAVALATFPSDSHAEQNRVSIAGLFNDPDADYWMWDYVVAADATYGTRTFTVQADGAASLGPVSLAARFAGLTAAGHGADHHARIALNGTVIGEAIWAGARPYEVTLAFDPTLLKAGANTVQVTGLLDAGVPYSVFYANNFDLAYQRTYRALNDTLAFTSIDNQAVTVYGFSSSNIMVFDLSSPQTPRRLTALKIEAADGGYRVTFKPGVAGLPYLAVATTAVPRITTLAVDAPSNLKGPNGADYVIVTTVGLAQPAQALASYRQSRGLQASVVDVQDIYDEFNGGVASPQAIQAFLAHAYANWNPAPRYVLLAGAGSFDYKNYLGYGDCLIPPIMVVTLDVIAPADGRYGDLTGDGAPEIAVGRLPVISAAELSAYVAKIQAYEAADPAGWSTRVLMLADNNDPAAGYFTIDSDRMAATVPDAYTVQKVYIGPLSASQARSQTLAAILAGAGVFNFIGHGGLDTLAAEKLLTSADVPNLRNGPRLPFMVAATCAVGNSALPGYRSLAVRMVLQADGGASAVFAPSGSSLNVAGAALDSALLAELFAGSSVHGGDATGAALAGFAAAGGPRYTLDTYNLLGDPAMEMIWR